MQKTTPFIVLAMLCLIFTTKAQTIHPIQITGKVTDQKGLPLSGATIKTKNEKSAALTNKQGNFTISSSASTGTLLISFLGYEFREISFTPTDVMPLTILLKEEESALKEVEIASTGYQTIPKERATGSFTIIDNKLLNRTASPDLLSRLKGVTNGLLFDSKVGNTTGISIRGRSTIFSNTEPLIVIDNFPFEGDLSSINPNDVESVSVLKDAAAASIWGVRAGNGVIVITTKKGRLNRKTTVSFNSNFTIGDKPDLYYQPQLSPAEFIDIEKFLYSKGKYTATLRNDYAVISPVIALLSKENATNTLATQAQIEALKQNDIRSQLNDYFYHKSVQQQYYLSLNGGGAYNTYNVSAGYDHDSPVLVGQSNDRYTLKANNTYDLIHHKLQLTTDLTFNRSVSKNDNVNGYVPLFPYEQVADQQGNPLPVLRSGGLRSSYTDTAGNGNLLNWKYRPLDELRQKANSFTSGSTDFRVNTGLRYQIITPLAVSVNYQYFSSAGLNETLSDLNSFETRNAINQVTQLNRTTGAILYPMPLGDTFNRSNSLFNSSYGRAQLDFQRTFSGKHAINAIAGYEIRSENSSANRQRLYGYDPETATSVVVDPITSFRYYYGSSTAKLGNNASSQSGSVDHYLSYYANASYIYDNRFIVSGSYRKDESNLFGVTANQKGVPLWSTGIAWNLDREGFYSLEWMPKLQLKATYGYNGNINKTISAYTTASPSSYPNNWATPFSNIINPPNPFLRWERVKNINLGLDFGLKNELLSGSIEYYLKNGVDLIGTSPIAPQTGVNTFTGNVADTRTKGIDIQLNSRNLTGLFKWSTSAIFNFSQDKVTNYQANTGSNGIIVNAGDINPLVGYPVNAIFSFKSAGLDGQGNPQGLISGQVSKDYTSIINSTNINELQYNGSAVPTVFGAVRNTFDWKSLELSFNITYKLGYFFRRASLQNGGLYNGSYQQSDYDKRWQKPGDELITNVPSLIYPASTSRDQFYTFSEGTATRGDHIRLNDVQLAYAFPSKSMRKIGLGSLSIYTYASNLGILWRANKYHLDPDARTGYPSPKSISFGIKTNF